MKSKLLTLMLLLLLAGTVGWTQNSYLDYKSAWKVYNLTSFEERRDFGRLDDSSASLYRRTNALLRIFNPAIAYQWKSPRNNFHELELSFISLSMDGRELEFVTGQNMGDQPIRGGDLRTAIISSRYEYILNFDKSKQNKFIPSLGFGVNPYFRHYNYTPNVSTSFPTSKTNVGIRTFVIPRITYFVSSKLFIDANIPLCFFDAYYFVDKIANPAIPVEQGINGTFNYDQFPKIFGGRVGIGLVL